MFEFTGLHAPGPTMLERMTEAGLSWLMFDGREMVDLLEYLRIIEPAPRRRLKRGNPEAAKSVLRVRWADMFMGRRLGMLRYARTTVIIIPVGGFVAIVYGFTVRPERRHL